MKRALLYCFLQSYLWALVDLTGTDYRSAGTTAIMVVYQAGYSMTAGCTIGSIISLPRGDEKQYLADLADFVHLMLTGLTQYNANTRSWLYWKSTQQVPNTSQKIEQTPIIKAKPEQA